LSAREYAANTLHLSFNNSFSEYAELHRDYVVRNLYAAPEFSTDLYSWCYPVIGCANYRGFFDEDMLGELQQDLDSQGYDTYISNVTAYSTLGWFADPVLNTFVALADYQLVALVFHELAHQQIYVSGDTFFNESFAMAVEQAGIKLFYAAKEDAADFQVFLEDQQQRGARIELAVQAREDLARIYQQPLSDASKRKHKQDVLQELKEQYLAQTESAAKEGAAPRFEFNNARLGAVAAYHKYVPGFLQILASHDDDFSQFYSHVDMLAQLEPEQRAMCLFAWSHPAEARGEQIPTMCAFRRG
jgi:predicted aminopeptidase